MAVDLTHRVFAWGRVRSRSPIEASQVRSVFAVALQAAGAPCERAVAEAPWSSGWTKVAAFATAHLDHDAHTVGHPQLIGTVALPTPFASSLMLLKHSYQPQPRLSSRLTSGKFTGEVVNGTD
ncbi:hypothetical protein [Methylorubrum zatmanii]